MDKLKLLKNQFSKAVASLDDVLKQEKNQYIRDSAIQRFEFTFDLAWKFLQAHLKDQGVQCNSPRSCIKEAFAQGMIEYDGFWLEMVKMRNLTSHTYHEGLAEQIFKDLPKVLEYFQKLELVALE